MLGRLSAGDAHQHSRKQANEWNHWQSHQSFSNHLSRARDQEIAYTLKFLVDNRHQNSLFVTLVQRLRMIASSFFS
jgi:hypothetical protein